MNVTIIGIDPGASGGIAIYKNNTATSIKMPKGTSALNNCFKTLRNDNEKCLVFLESVSHWSGGNDDAPGKKFAIAKMMNQFQELKTLLSVNNLPYVEVHSASWQSALIKRVKGETKQQRKTKYKLFASETYSYLKVTLAISDALCIMSFGRLKFESDIYWIESRLEGISINDLIN